MGRILLLLALLPAHVGCVLGAKGIRGSRAPYNHALEETNREELLLNLVRMRYHDSNEFVRISSITQQFQYDASLGGSARWQETTPNVLTAALGGGAQNRPTITLTPEQDQQFSTRILTPIKLDTLLLLASKGWAADRVLGMTVRRINDVENAISAGGPTPLEKPEFERFHHVARMIRELQKRNHSLEISYMKLVDVDAKPTGMVLPLHNVDGEDCVMAAKSGYEWRTSDDGKSLELWQSDKIVDGLILRVSPEAIDSPEWTEISRVLELEPRLPYYRMLSPKRGQLRQPGHWRMGVEGVQDRDYLMVSTRSLKEMMFYLSHAIRVPDKHLNAGLVTTTFDSCGEYFDWDRMTGDLLRVQCSKSRPKCAAVKVHYNGYWFYVDDRDLNSQNTFNLLLELFNLEIRGGGAVGAPVLTIGA